MSTVLDLARERIRIAFDEFDTVLVAFSGGKDSGVMVNLAVEHARAIGYDKPVHVVHVDYEGQYTATTEYVERTMRSNLDVIKPWWLCLPISAQCAVSMFQDHWVPWEESKRDLWVREMPPEAITEHNHPFDFEVRGIWDNAVLGGKFARWLHNSTGADRTIQLVGIREQESLHRYSAIHNKQDMYEDHKWTTRQAPGIYSGYPIHDWLTEDVWTANARFGWDYNRLYDLMYQAGVPLHSMRVASPFLSEGTDALKMYRVIEPAMWARLVGRVNGANFTAIYGGTSAMGWRNVTLPEGHTWRTYCEFLLSTLPSDIRARYEKKFATSVKYWTRDGGALRADLAAELRNKDVNVEFLGKPTNNRKYTTEYEVVRFADYPDDLDLSDFASVPTYKRMVITILKNDHACKYMGFGQTKLELQKRRDAIAKYEELL